MTTTLTDRIRAHRDEEPEAVEMALAILRGDISYSRRASDLVDLWEDLDREVYRQLVQQWNAHVPSFSPSWAGR